MKVLLAVSGDRREANPQSPGQAWHTDATLAIPDWPSLTP